LLGIARLILRSLAGKPATRAQVDGGGGSLPGIPLAKVLSHCDLRVMEYRHAPESIFLCHNGHQDKLGLLGQVLTRADDSSIEVVPCHVRSKKSQVAHIL
jgi:hypothetical protein